MEQAPVDIRHEPRFLLGRSSALVRLGVLLGAAGVTAAAAAAIAGEGGRSFFFAYLLNYAFFLSLALGALFFVILQHLTRAGWSVVLRRLAEGVAATLPVLAVLFLPVVVGLPHLYHWSHPEIVAHDPLLQRKAPYLNVPFFLLRWGVYLAVWSLLARFFLARSTAQDASADVAETHAMQRRAAPAMLLFAITVTFAAFDLLMSLDAHWFSTIFGVYFFAGGLVGFVALLVVVAFAVQRAGLLPHAITREHYHDLGKLLFAFVVFWAYIGFSQYMLMAYANLPEETGWFLRRQNGGWGWVGLLLIFGHFLLPFLALLARLPKRRKQLLVPVAAWVLAMHWVDLFFIVGPERSPQGFALSAADVLLLLAFSGVMVSSFARTFRTRSLLAEGDPRLEESLTFENA
jgi:hypothetical protein